MFKGFTDQARKAVSSAKQEAGHLNHEGVDTEHLLLALVRERIGVAVAALERLGLSHTQVRLEVMKFVQPGFGTVIASDEPFTSRLRKVFELAAEAAHRLGHTRIGTEHLLLGLLMEREGVASEVLEKLHLSVDRLRREIQTLHLMYAQFVTDLARRDPLMKMAVEEHGLVTNQVAETEKQADSGPIEVGKIYQGKVKRIMNFGAFCEILPGKEGLVHISELADPYINKIEDVVKVGDEFPVKVI